MNRTHTDAHIFSRRNAMGMAIVGSLLAPAAFSTGIAHAAAAAVVEIVAFSHTRVASALKPLRDWLAMQGGKFKLVETDMESPAGAQRLQAVGVKGHVPIVILVNGEYQQKRADGSAVELISFPVAAGAQGWTLEDAKFAITQATTR